jgi:hypothetical protein
LVNGRGLLLFLPLGAFEVLEVEAKGSEKQALDVQMPPRLESLPLTLVDPSGK